MCCSWCACCLLIVAAVFACEMYVLRCLVIGAVDSLSQAFHLWYVVCCLMRVGCLSYVVCGCLLCDVCCLLLFMVCCSLVCELRCLLFAVRLLVVRCWCSAGVCCLLFVVYYLLFVLSCSLSLVVRCLLFVDCCLLCVVCVHVDRCVRDVY